MRGEGRDDIEQVNHRMGQFLVVGAIGNGLVQQSEERCEVPGGSRGRVLLLKRLVHSFQDHNRLQARVVSIDAHETATTGGGVYSDIPVAGSGG